MEDNQRASPAALPRRWGGPARPPAAAGCPHPCWEPASTGAGASALPLWWGSVEAAGGDAVGQGAAGQANPPSFPLGPWGSGTGVWSARGMPSLQPGDCPKCWQVTDRPSLVQAQFSSSSGCPCTGLPTTGTWPRAAGCILGMA